MIDNYNKILNNTLTPSEYAQQIAIKLGNYSSEKPKFSRNIQINNQRQLENQQLSIQESYQKLQDFVNTKLIKQNKEPKKPIIRQDLKPQQKFGEQVQKLQQNIKQLDDMIFNVDQEIRQINGNFKIQNNNQQHILSERLQSIGKHQKSKSFYQISQLEKPMLQLNLEHVQSSPYTYSNKNNSTQMNLNSQSNKFQESSQHNSQRFSAQNQDKQSPNHHDQYGYLNLKTVSQKNSQSKINSFQNLFPHSSKSTKLNLKSPDSQSIIDISLINESSKHKRQISQIENSLQRKIKMLDLSYNSLSQTRQKSQQNTSKSNKITDNQFDYYDQEVQNLQLQQILRGHKNSITGLALMQSQLISSSLDRSVILWKNTKTQLNNFNLYQILALQSYGQQIYAGLANGSVGVCSLNQNEFLKKFQAHKGQILDLQIMAQKQLLISCSNDCLIKSWDSTTLQNVSKFNGHSKKINCLITQNDQIYSGGNDLIIKVWDHKQQKHIFDLHGHQNSINNIKILDNNLITTQDNQIKIWDIRKREVVQHFEVESKINCIELLNDKQFILGCDNLILYDQFKNKIQKVFQYNFGSIKKICLDKNNSKLYCGCFDTNIYQYEICQ